MSIIQHISSRILVLDGAMGSLIQRHQLKEEDFRGKRFVHSPHSQKGNCELLNLTQPHIIGGIHEQYFAAGADIVSTNTFNANRISLVDYGVEDLVTEINTAAVHLAREAAREYTRKTPNQPRFVAASIGPTNKSLSLSPDVNRLAHRAVTFVQMQQAYYEQIAAVVQAGADVLLFETAFDTLNLKAALFAAMEYANATGTQTPMMVSGTISDASGRLLSGQQLEAFLVSVSHAPLMSIGLNCALGAEQMKPYIEEMAKKAPFHISAHPNAGLPNQQGGYDQTPAQMAAIAEQYMQNGWVNIVGGCCGTTPEYIALLAKAAPKYKPRQVPTTNYHLPSTNSQLQSTVLSGLEPIYIDHQTTFGNEMVDGRWNLVLVGERANVAGSRKFARLIGEEKYEEALVIARQQVEIGAQVIDICMDDALLDARKEMTHFLNLIASEPDICKIPVMIDSSKWEVIEAGLQCVQGKSIVNSISLKEGEAEFIRKAKLVHQYGAAVVVMLFDEQGQADTYERKIAVAERSYRLIADKIIPSQDIIFDPNVLAIATGIAEHNIYALDFIRACEWIKKNLPNAKISGGVSNLSFSFRGNDEVRGALHAVFLYHAAKAGMDMGIVNPTIGAQLSKINPTTIGSDPLLSLCQDVILNQSDDATERLIIYAQNNILEHHTATTAPAEDRTGTVEERIARAVSKGITDHLKEDIDEALQHYSAMQIIEQPLMNAMNAVGDSFGAGKMFLPQVVKSARVLKTAVALLEPHLAAASATEERKKKTKILLATVKGDVHDIGKNIVSVVLSCNDFEIIDLGVMVPCEKFLAAIEQHQPDLVGLSGLITPSLDEMERVAQKMNELQLTVPLLLGGAATNALHAALKLEPAYPQRVFYVKDASRAAGIARQLTTPELKPNFVAQQQQQSEQLRSQYSAAQQRKELLTPEEARANRLKIDWANEKIVVPKFGISVERNTPLSLLVPHIDWSMFFYAWNLRGVDKDIAKSQEAQRLQEDALQMLQQLEREKQITAQAVIGYFPAASQDDNLLIYNELRTSVRVTLPTPRQLQKQPAGQANLSVADFVAPQDTGVQDFVGAFALSVQPANPQLIQDYRTAGDDYNALLVETLCHRLAEAYSQCLHQQTKGIRVAVGYPMLPNHSQKAALFDLLDVTQNIGTTLTESFMMQPGASVCGLIFANKEARYF
ncbi:methionine synthase [Bacteroidia bacterium]|nr:methionine synthase [Bacteroidia bacterium]